jgi:putative aldouronate transport system permease protein
MAADQMVAVNSDTMKMATLVVATLPIICVYPFLQKYFVKGIMIGSLKG